MIAPPPNTAAQNGKTHGLPAEPSEADQLTRVLDLTLELLIARTVYGDRWLQGFHEVQDLLARVPIGLAGFAFASRRLRNAHLYCVRQEYGAAAFELRALRGELLRL